VSAPTTRITAVAALLVGLAGVPAFAEEEEQAFVLLPDKSLGSLASLDSLDAKPPPAVTDSVKWGRDWIGLGRDTALIFGYQVVTITMFYFLPESVSKWSDQQKKDILKRWVDNVQSPHWDHDAFAINYFGHPYSAPPITFAPESAGSANSIHSCAQAHASGRRGHPRRHVGIHGGGQAAGDPQGRWRPVHPGRNDPLGEERRYRPRSGARDVYRREREAAHHGGAVSAQRS